MTAQEQVKKTASRNSLIERSFRDTADRDYIAARLLHRSRLTEQFLWSALQAVEKYLKAILLYHDRPTKRLNHDLARALGEVDGIGRLGFTIGDGARSFIRYLDEQGPNRYFMFPRFTTGHELMELDSAVWQVRRFCDDFFFPHEDEELVKINGARLRHVQGREIQKDRIRFRLDSRGFLEKVLDGSKHPELRRRLIWKNLYFGNRRRSSVEYNSWWSWSQPSNLVYPEILDWAERHVKLPKAVKAEMAKRLRARGES